MAEGRAGRGATGSHPGTHVVAPGLLGGGPSPALRLATRIVQARPQRADAHNLLGAVLSAKRDRDGAAAAFREATRLEPENGVYFANLGEVERLRGNLDAALAALETAVRLDPD